MLSAVQVAKYFLFQDSDSKVFGKKLIEKNGRTFYEGNARLNKYLHIAQNMYIAKTGEQLFSDDLYAYDNGAVALDVQQNYSLLITKRDCPDLPITISSFLDKIYHFLAPAQLDELIELSHEDNEWIAKHGFYSKKDQRMDSMSHAKEYAEQYKDALYIMETME